MNKKKKWKWELKNGNLNNNEYKMSIKICKFYYWFEYRDNIRIHENNEELFDELNIYINRY